MNISEEKYVWLCGQSKHVRVSGENSNPLANIANSFRHFPVSAADRYLVTTNLLGNV